MARNKIIASILVTAAVCLVCVMGCDQPEATPKSNPNNDKQSAPSTNVFESDAASNLNPAESNSVNAETAAKTKPAEPSLDDSVKVDELLSMRLPEEDLSMGWIRLFDGQSLMGWRNAGSSKWHIEDGALMASDGEPGLLCTSVRFSDFELMLEYRASSMTNSGVFFRNPLQPTDPSKDCFELNIASPENPFPTGSLVGRAKVNDKIESPEPGEWHTLHALVDRNHIQVWLNGNQSVDYMDTTDLVSGYIGLQFREGPIRFRNIRIRPISYAVLPAKDLKDFNKPAGAVQANLSEKGSLELMGGKGHLELLQPHANCLIQLSVKTLAENVNSGLFFRCIPGEDMNGYECQIHHGFKVDRRVPEDGGMGAIFRRQNAKAVLSDPSKETFITVAADGPRICSWVNGIQVTDFEDQRKADENPRKGLRLDAGTIMLQGHDPTCKVRFDSLNICPLP